MKLAQTIWGLVLISVGAVFCVASLKQGLGRVNVPGPGLVPFGFSCLLILFAVGTVIEALLSKRSSKVSGIFEWQKWKPFLFVLIPLFVYALILDIVGFLPATFLILILLFKISEKHSWAISVVLSVITTISTYLFFGYFLGIQFPRGFFSF